MTKIKRLAAAFLFSLFLTTASYGATIVNLSSSNVYVATAYWDNYSSSSGGFMAVTNAGWNFTGWYTVKPGDSFTSKSDGFYVETNGRPLTWNNVDTFSGLVRNGSKFSIKVNKNTASQDVQKYKSKGFKKVKYMKFKDQRYIVTGDAYRLENKTVKFNFKTRDHYGLVSKKIHPGGKIANYYVDAKSYFAKDINWEYMSDRRGLRLTGTVQGPGQQKLFGPRVEAYYKGSVKIYYTVRN